MSKNRPYWVMCPQCEEQFEMGTTDIPVEEIKAAWRDDIAKWKANPMKYPAIGRWERIAEVLGLTLEGE